MILSSCSSGQPVQAALLEEREEREERRSLGGGMGLGDDMVWPVVLGSRGSEASCARRPAVGGEMRCLGSPR